MVNFTSVKFECQLSGTTWTDITADVRHNPYPTWNKGFQSNGITDRVADPGRLTFHLDNSASNSGGTLGWYTPYSANPRSGWGPGKKVRLSLAYGGHTHYKFYGYIPHDGIVTAPGTYGPRDVQVTVGDYFDFLSRTSLQNMAILSSPANVGTAMNAIYTNVGRSPLNVDGTAAAGPVCPTVFDNQSANVNALGEVQKIAQSYGQFVYITCNGNSSDGETILYQNRAGDAALVLHNGGTATFDNNYLANQMKVSYGKNYINRLTVTFSPKKTDAAATTVLWRLQEPVLLAAGATIYIVGKYRDDNAGREDDINGTAMVTPASTTDYLANDNSDGSGTNRTASLSVTADLGSASVKWTLTNGTGGDFYITKLQCRGKGVYNYDPMPVQTDDATGQASYGIISANFDRPYYSVATSTYTLYAQNLWPIYNALRNTIDSASFLANDDENAIYCFLELEPGESAIVKEGIHNLNNTFYINGYSAQIINMKYVVWTPTFGEALTWWA